MRPPRVPPSAGVRWRSAGTASPQGLAVSGLTPKEGSALQAAPSRDATPLRSVHPRAGGDGAADLSPLGGKARSAKGAV